MRLWGSKAGQKIDWIAVERALSPAITALVDDAVTSAIAVSLARGLVFDPDEVAQIIADLTPDYIAAWKAQVISTSKDRIDAAVAAYTDGGINLDELMARVDSVFDPSRADAFAITETTNIYQLVSEVINDASGVEKVRYLSVRDSFVCPECQVLDNQIFTVDEMDEDNTPPIHPNCRCFTAAEVPEAQSAEPVAA